MKRPTIDELEAILAKDEKAPIHLLPNGEIRAGPIELTAPQLIVCEQWAADDRLWNTQETVEFNLKTFARLILKLQLEEDFQTPQAPLDDTPRKPGATTPEPSEVPCTMEADSPAGARDRSLPGQPPVLTSNTTVAQNACLPPQ